MFITGDHDQTIEELRRQLEAAEAAKAVQEKEEKALVRAAQRVAGESHTRLALALYELLGVEPEHPGTRTVNGRVREVAADKEEKLRTERLYGMIVELVEQAGPALLDQLRSADEAGRAARRPKRKRETTGDEPEASAANEEDDAADSFEHQDEAADEFQLQRTA